MVVTAPWETMERKANQDPGREKEIVKEEKRRRSRSREERHRLGEREEIETE